MKMIEQKLVPMSRKLTEEIASMEPVPGDRDEKGWRVDHVAEKMKAGMWHGCKWVVLKTPDGKRYRINGKHTSQAALRLWNDGHAGVMDDKARVEYQLWEGSLSEAPQLYLQFDAPESSRRPGDYIKCEIASSNGRYGSVSNRAVSVSVAALCFQTEGRSRRLTNDDRIRLLRANMPLVQFVEDTLGSKAWRSLGWLARAPVVAAMHATRTKHAIDAAEFWSVVRDGEGMNNTDPRKRVRDYLMTARQGGGGGHNRVGVGSRTVSSRELYVKCIRAWNAWREGKTTDLKYYQRADAPEAV